jgi:hypothetical protein
MVLYKNHLLLKAPQLLHLKFLRKWNKIRNINIT